jgi:hypothetical protein
MATLRAQMEATVARFSKSFPLDEINSTTVDSTDNDGLPSQW